MRCHFVLVASAIARDMRSPCQQPEWRAINIKCCNPVVRIQCGTYSTKTSVVLSGILEITVSIRLVDKALSEYDFVQK